MWMTGILVVVSCLSGLYTVLEGLGKGKGMYSRHSARLCLRILPTCSFHNDYYRITERTRHFFAFVHFFYIRKRSHGGEAQLS